MDVVGQKEAGDQQSEISGDGGWMFGCLGTWLQDGGGGERTDGTRGRDGSGGVHGMGYLLAVWLAVIGFLSYYFFFTRHVCAIYQLKDHVAWSSFKFLVTKDRPLGTREEQLMPIVMADQWISNSLCTQSGKISPIYSTTVLRSSITARWYLARLHAPPDLPGPLRGSDPTTQSHRCRPFPWCRNHWHSTLE